VQIGVYHVLASGPPFPGKRGNFSRPSIRAQSRRFDPGNLFLGGFPNATYGRPGRDEEIEKVKQSIEAAGKAGIRWSSTTFMPIVRLKATSSRRAAEALG
jgi:mannonate dehydratase